MTWVDRVLKRRNIKRERERDEYFKSSIGTQQGE